MPESLEHLPEKDQGSGRFQNTSKVTDQGRGLGQTVLPLHTTWPEPDTQTQAYAQDLSKNIGYLLLQITGSYLNYVLKVLIVF